MEEKKPFTYTYSAQQREEIQRIRKKYLPPEEDKMARLRRLDESAARPGRTAAIVLGVVSTLIFGVGMPGGGKSWPRRSCASAGS